MPEDEEDDYDDISELQRDPGDRELQKLNKQLEQASHEILSSKRDGEEASEAGTVGEEGTNFYKENIFNKEDYYLYRAVMYFYAGEYDKALNDFEQSSSIMHAQKVLYPRNQFPDGDLGEGAEQFSGGEGDNQSHQSSQTDLSDVGLCSLNIHEYSFNTVICLL